MGGPGVGPRKRLEGLPGPPCSPAGPDPPFCPGGVRDAVIGWAVGVPGGVAMGDRSSSASWLEGHVDPEPTKTVEPIDVSGPTVRPGGALIGARAATGVLE